MPDWPIIAGALWLGILTSISPCPLATNIAAIAFLGRKSDQRAAVVWSSVAYITGRACAYIALALVLAAGMTSAPDVTAFFRTKLSGLLGPGILIVGMAVSGWIPIKLPSSGGLNALGTKLAANGWLGEFLMGVVFAVAFCPVSAALFFGGLIPGTIQSGATISLPLAYGVGTALPVVIAGALISGGVSTASRRKLINLQSLGAKLQRATGAILICVGAWITVTGMMK